jgi:DNA repair exonuclease SbcCD ATPase subunit
MNATNSAEKTCGNSPEVVLPRRTRIDAPHPPASDQQPSSIEPAGEAAILVGSSVDGGAAEERQPLLEVEEPTAEMIAAVAGESLDSRREQMQLQVAQLAGHLRERLREVDRREATLNARLAQLESDLRASRMWLRERELEFQERESDLKRQIEELQDHAHTRGIEIQTVAFDDEARQAEMNERDEQLRLREDDLRERRFEVDRQAAALRHAQQLWQQQHEQEQRHLVRDREQLTRDCELAAAQREEQLRFNRFVATGGMR